MNVIGCSTQNTLQHDKSAQQLRPRVLADLHCHPMLDDWIANSPIAQSQPFLFEIVKKLANPTTINWQKCHDAGIDMMCVAHFNVFDEWFSMPTDPNPDAPAHTTRMMRLLEEKVQEISPIAKIVKNATDLREHLDKTKQVKTPSYQIAIVHCLEGGHAMGAAPGAIEELAAGGVAMIEITHFFQKDIGSAANSFPFFHDQDARWPHRGLTEHGKQIIRDMNAHGIIVDVAHSTSTAIRDVLEISRCPIIASHVSSRTLADHPYSLTDEQIKEIADGGGIIGVICEPWWESNFATNKDAERKGSIDDIIRTIEYFAKISGGTDHIGVGSDFAGYITAPSDWRELGEIERLWTRVDQEFGDDVKKIMAQNVIDFFVNNWGRKA